MALILSTCPKTRIPTVFDRHSVLTGKAALDDPFAGPIAA